MLTDHQRRALSNVKSILKQISQSDNGIIATPLTGQLKSTDSTTKVIHRYIERALVRKARPFMFWLALLFFLQLFTETIRAQRLQSSRQTALIKASLQLEEQCRLQVDTETKLKQREAEVHIQREKDE